MRASHGVRHSCDDMPAGDPRLMHSWLPPQNPAGLSSPQICEILKRSPRMRSASELSAFESALANFLVSRSSSRSFEPKRTPANKALQLTSLSRRLRRRSGARS